MSCGVDLIECQTIQIIEPRDDLLVDTAGSTSDMDERGELPLVEGQVNAFVDFTVHKLNTNYHFEYLYIDAIGNAHPGATQIIPTSRQVDGFAVVFAGAPIGDGYVLYWRVTIVRSSTSVQIDTPEDLYLQMPKSSLMSVTFVHERSNTDYGFTELRVENLHDAPESQQPIHVQVYQKMLGGFLLAVNPRPRTDFYFLKVRTP